MAKAAKPVKRKFSAWQTVRDVLVESMRRGQLPLLSFACVIALILWKTPTDYFPTLWEKVFEIKGSIMSVSVVLNLVLVFGWYFNAKSLRRRFKDENLRLIDERNVLQEKHGVPIKSSRS
jgi:hypothetical protein